MKKKVSHSDQRNALPADQMPELDESDAQPKPEATPEQIANIIKLSREQIRLDRRAAAVEEVLSRAKKKLQNNITNVLPKAMREAGIDATPLGDKGASVELEVVVSASIPNANNKKVERAAERNATGIAYMDKHAPDMVSTILTIEFPKGTEAELKKFLADNKRRKKPLVMELNRTVNTSSLGKWVRTQDKLGKTVDEEALNVHRVDIAKVSLPKEKKDKIG